MRGQTRSAPTSRLDTRERDTVVQYHSSSPRQQQRPCSYVETSHREEVSAPPKPRPPTTPRGCRGDSRTRPQLVWWCTWDTRCTSGGPRGGRPTCRSTPLCDLSNLNIINEPRLLINVDMKFLNNMNFEIYK